MELIGREKEVKLLDGITSSGRAEFVAIYGRRRIGKTYLVHQHFSQKGLYFECAGLKDGKLSEQLKNFMASYRRVFYPGIESDIDLEYPKSWREAFELLTKKFSKIPKGKKIILFLDELPWLASQKSGLIQTLDYFWNTQWNRMPNFILVVCGSSASWMLDNLINAKGGLHNRLTRSILLEPFTLAETKKYLEKQKIKASDRDILDIYMVMGGVPYYLSHLEKSKSVSQNINNLCFNKDGVLYNEFPRLFRSLFDAAELNIKIVRELSQRRYGMPFAELLAGTGKKAGGRFQDRLNELEAAGFIQRFLPYGRKKRDHHYRVTDPYVLFYLKWIEELVEGKGIPKRSDYWGKLSKSPAWLSWGGYTFEMVCCAHIDKIINALGLNGINCMVSHWSYRPDRSSGKDQGAEIDMLLDRDDGAITLLEMKYATNPFVIDKSYAKNLMSKMDIFEEKAKPQKQLFLAMVTTMGLKRTAWSEELVHGEVTLKDLF